MSGIDAFCECVSLKGSSEHSKHYRNECLNERPNEGRGKTGVVGAPALQNSQDVDCRHLSLRGLVGKWEREMLAPCDLKGTAYHNDCVSLSLGSREKHS